MIKYNWKNIHPDFTPELQKEWEKLGFNWEQVQKWIENGSLEPTDADFAFFLKKAGHIAETIDDILDELREEYDKAAKNKEGGFAFEEEKEITTSKERSWGDIHRDFAPDLVQRWQEHGFGYEEVNDWINIGMGVSDNEFCAWLRNIKGVDAEWVLNHGSIEELQSEYQQYYLLITQQFQIKE